MEKLRGRFTRKLWEPETRNTGQKFIAVVTSGVLVFRSRSVRFTSNPSLAEDNPIPWRQRSCWNLRCNRIFDPDQKSYTYCIQQFLAVSLAVHWFKRVNSDGVNSVHPRIKLILLHRELGEIIRKKFLSHNILFFKILSLRI